MDENDLPWKFWPESSTQKSTSKSVCIGWPKLVDRSKSQICCHWFCELWVMGSVFHDILELFQKNWDFHLAGLFSLRSLSHSNRNTSHVGRYAYIYPMIRRSHIHKAIIYEQLNTWQIFWKCDVLFVYATPNRFDINPRGSRILSNGTAVLFFIFTPFLHPAVLIGCFYLSVHFLDLQSQLSIDRWPVGCCRLRPWHMPSFRVWNVTIPCPITTASYPGVGSTGEFLSRPNLILGIIVTPHPIVFYHLVALHWGGWGGGGVVAVLRLQG